MSSTAVIVPYFSGAQPLTNPNLPQPPPLSKPQLLRLVKHCPHLSNNNNYYYCYCYCYCYDDDDDDDDDDDAKTDENTTEKLNISQATLSCEKPECFCLWELLPHCPLVKNGHRHLILLLAVFAHDDRVKLPARLGSLSASKRASINQ
ncbi:hypothetical protein PAAG_03633 [Paracoccidioides lutzii Pb01]|uniref:Uncharacterized protein n=1 Tax=Paracoccidioides lutzii (strain ATCC MYA-826 / Pb01) TaxID=502779 RepID=C1GXR0_PARBA|nr:hypothetical protein PAAG_03633 [Paracoccidioides lutzii Pb01]EEH41348.2 hypothetical protein PAAG_03633 [Paracoccidioides lutzii Pb01]